MKQTGPNPADLAASADTYAEDGVSTYVVCRQL
jgi:hypothetical protein